MKILLSLLLCIFQTIAIAETIHKRNEITTNILIFDAYLNAIEINRQPDKYKTISLVDPQWQQAALKNSNSINKVYYSSSDSVVLINDKYGFFIVFVPSINYKKEVSWSCKIEGAGTFFNLFQPDTCTHWSRRMVKGSE
jgi:hypothetical protein